jgi:tyrosinase
MRIRRNIKELTSGQKSSFVDAVLKLKKAPGVLLTNGNRYDDYVQIHVNAMMASTLIDPNGDPDDINNIYPGWAHNGPAFFPWHRVLLLEFENDLRKISNNLEVTIPYWDWTDTDPKASPFTEDFMGGDGVSTGTEEGGKVIDGPFAYDGPNHWTINVNDPMEDHSGPHPPKYLTRGLGRRNDAKSLPDSTVVNKALNNPVYDYPPWKFAKSTPRGARAQIEYDLHNLVHRYVTGNMITMASPNDPVFWLHHANIDRLWGDWQRKNQESCPYSPVGNAGPGHNLYDKLIFSQPSTPRPWRHSYTNVKVLNHFTLGYKYDSDPGDAAFFVLPRGGISRLSELPKESRKFISSLQRFPSMRDILDLIGKDNKRGSLGHLR